MTVITSRRSFIRGAVATLFAAPAIVRCGSLMPVKVIPDLRTLTMEEMMKRAYELTHKAINENIYNAMFIRLNEGVNRDPFIRRIEAWQ